MQTLKFRFITVFGKDADDPFDEIQKVTNEILFAANRLGNIYWRDQGRRSFTEKQFEKHLAEMDKYENIVWASIENDEIEKKVDKCIKKIERYCFSVMKQ